MFIYVNATNCNNIDEYLEEFEKMTSKYGFTGYFTEYDVKKPKTESYKSITTNEQLFNKALELDAVQLYNDDDFKLIRCREESIDIFVKYFGLWHLNYTNDGMYIAQYNKKTDSITFLSYTNNIFVEKRIKDGIFTYQTVNIDNLYETNPKLFNIYESLLPVDNPYFWAITTKHLRPSNDAILEGLTKSPFALHYLIKNHCLSITLDEDKLTLYAVNKILKKNFFNKYRRLTTDNMLKIVKENPKLIGLFRFSTPEMQIHACIKDSNNCKYIINPCYYITKLFGKK